MGPALPGFSLYDYTPYGKKFGGLTTSGRPAKPAAKPAEPASYARKPKTQDQLDAATSGSNADFVRGAFSDSYGLDLSTSATSPATPAAKKASGKHGKKAAAKPAEKPAEEGPKKDLSYYQGLKPEEFEKLSPAEVKRAKDLIAEKKEKDDTYATLHPEAAKPKESGPAELTKDQKVDAKLGEVKTVSRWDAFKERGIASLFTYGDKPDANASPEEKARAMGEAKGKSESAADDAATLRDKADTRKAQNEKGGFMSFINKFRDNPESLEKQAEAKEDEAHTYNKQNRTVATADVEAEEKAKAKANGTAQAPTAPPANETSHERHLREAQERIAKKDTLDKPNGAPATSGETRKPSVAQPNGSTPTETEESRTYISPAVAKLLNSPEEKAKAAAKGGMNPKDIPDVKSDEQLAQERKAQEEKERIAREEAAKVPPSPAGGIVPPAAAPF